MNFRTRCGAQVRTWAPLHGPVVIGPGGHLPAEFVTYSAEVGAPTVLDDTGRRRRCTDVQVCVDELGNAEIQSSPLAKDLWSAVLLPDPVDDTVARPRILRGVGPKPAGDQ